MSAIETVDLMLLQAAVSGELEYDGDTTYGIRWRGTTADFALSNRVANLRIDGLVGYDEQRGSCPVEVTADGWEALLSGGLS